jgi:hypothetical protein
MNEDQTSPLSITPRFWPRDFVDGCLSAAVGSFQTIVLFGIPAGVAFLLTRSAIVAALVACAAYGCFMSFVVHRISVSPEGIRFHRSFGSPKFLPWERITSIAVAPRSELIVHGWVWPLFPAREMTACLSSLQHYRIAWEGGSCYYPPAEPSLFEQHVATYLKTRKAS